jgi:Holliday junction resolvase
MNAGAIMTGLNSQRRVQLAPPGCPDIIGWQKGTGKFIGVECKIKPNKPTYLQEEFAKDMQADGCIYVLAYSLTDVEKVL